MQHNLIIVSMFLLVLTPVCHAIEGLQISVVHSNAVLTWPSTNDGSETFLVQYRSNLVSGAWTTLADFLPASPSNTTTFVDVSNLVQMPAVVGGGGGGGGGGNIIPQAMAKPANSSGAAAPLAIYPPGFDFSDYVISNPSTGLWESGSRYAANHPLTGSRAQSGGGVQPMDETGADTNQYTGFYRVVRDGVHLWGITNGMVVSNVLVTTIEFAVTNTDQVVGVTFYDTNSDSPLIGASCQSLGSNRWLLVWNTTMTFNGDYAVEAELNFASDPTVISQPVTVAVNNAILFPNYFSQVYGDQMWIYAVTLPNAHYTLDLYDENTNYMGTFEDYADSSGTISFLWGLQDYNGNLSDSTNFLGVLTVDTDGESEAHSQAATQQIARPTDLLATTPVRKTISAAFTPQGGGAHPNDGGSSAVSADQLWVKEGKWAPNNNWVVCYASLTNDSTVDKRATYMIVGGAGSPSDWGGVLGTLDQYGLGGNLSPGNNAQGGTVFTLQDTNSRNSLLGYLADTRYENFYYFGHGNDSAISAYNAAVTAITGEQLAHALGNVPLSMNYGGPVIYSDIATVMPIVVQPTIVPSVQHAALHPYRFVWIDACDAAKGNFCEAFGIPALTVSTNFFAAAGVESRAFLSYTEPIEFDDSLSSLDRSGVPNHSIMLADFLTAWLSGQIDLNTIVTTAKAGAFGYGTPSYLPNQYKMDSSAVIYGAYDLKRLTFTRPQ